MDKIPGKSQGVLPILHTPFADNGSIDWQGLEREVDWGYDVGCWVV